MDCYFDARSFTAAPPQEVGAQLLDGGHWLVQIDGHRSVHSSYHICIIIVLLPTQRIKKSSGRRNNVHRHRWGWKSVPLRTVPRPQAANGCCEATGGRKRRLRDGQAIGAQIGSDTASSSAFNCYHVTFSVSNLDSETKICICL